MPRLIIFDCDGTLVDSEQLCNLALSRQLEHYGVHVESTELMDKYRGQKLAKILSALEHTYGIEFESNFTEEYRRDVSTLFASDLKPCDGVLGVLEEIQQPVCVASSGPKEKIQDALGVTGLAAFFGANLFSSYEISSWKPDPGIFLHAARTMGFAPSDCLVVEDSAIGIKAANAAGMESVLYDPRRNGQVTEADHTVDNMQELLAITT